jgi:hypothetical protein
VRARWKTELRKRSKGTKGKKRCVGGGTTVIGASLAEVFRGSLWAEFPRRPFIAVGLGRHPAGHQTTSTSGLAVILGVTGCRRCFTPSSLVKNGNRCLGHIVFGSAAAITGLPKPQLYSPQTTARGCKYVQISNIIISIIAYRSSAETS